MGFAEGLAVAQPMFGIGDMIALCHSEDIIPLEKQFEPVQEVTSKIEKNV